MSNPNPALNLKPDLAKKPRPSTKTGPIAKKTESGSNPLKNPDHNSVALISTSRAVSLFYPH